MNWNKFLPCILLTTVLGACSGKGEQPNVEPAALCLTDSLLRIVSVDTVHVQEVIDELTLNGRVTFNENQVAHVYPMFGGTVTELKAEIGDYVRKGDVLAVIRSGEVADYEKQLKEAEQQLLLARRNMDATQDMYASGMASDKDVLQAKQELATAEAEERRIKEIFSIYQGNIPAGFYIQFFFFSPEIKFEGGVQIYYLPVGIQLKQKWVMCLISCNESGIALCIDFPVHTSVPFNS